MMRRSHPPVWIACLGSLGLAGTVGLVCHVAACSIPDSGRPERIILIVVDTLRVDRIGAYGSSIPTPNIDGLAARGQIFRNAVSSFHQTSMSMGALFTGVTPSIESGDAERALPWTNRTFCGLARFSSSSDSVCVPDAVTTLAEDLAAAGYSTLGVVSNPLLFRPFGFDQGFERWLEVGPIPKGKTRNRSRREHAELRSGKDVNRVAIDALSTRPSDRFFFYVHYLDVHDWVLLGRPYKAGVIEFDRYLGELLAYLEKEKLLEDAYVILTSDHGETLGERHPLPNLRNLGMHFGNPSFEPVLRIPLIIAPSFFENVTRTVRSQDLRNMVREIAGIEPVSVSGQADELYLGERYFQTYRKGRWKSSWHRSGRDAYLFDLEADPGEKRDVSAEYAEVMEEHRLRIDSLAGELHTREGSDSEQTEADRERLRALGYIE
jgi:arylsulfatase A-like enzyme